MRLIKLDVDKLSFNAEELGVPVTLVRGKTYIVPDYTIELIKEKEREDKSKILAKDQDLYKVYKKFDNKIHDLNDKNLFIIRSGGIGDLIFLTPIVRHLKIKYPSARIFLSCMPRLQPLFRGLPYYEGMLDVPIDIAEMSDKTPYGINPNNTYFMTIEGLIETDPRAQTMNVYDLLKEVFGITESIPYNPEIAFDQRLFNSLKEYYFSEDETATVKLNIGFQMSSSALVRTWKPHYTVDFFNSWKIPNTRFFIFDSPNRKEYVQRYLMKVNNPLISFVNLPQERSELRSSAHLVKMMDLVITPDSSIAHIAGCFDTPIVGLFGAFHSDLRLKYYKNVVALNAMTDCPLAMGDYKCCFDHSSSCKMAVVHNRYYSPCMDAIQPKMVYEKTIEFLTQLGKI